jgi:hypothetical protein
MNEQKIYVGDTPKLSGTFKEFDPSLGLPIQDDDAWVVVDVSGADTKEILISDPDKNRVDKSATFETDGTDGEVYYQCVTTDLDEGGMWKLQGKATWADGKVYHSDFGSFRVYKTL